MTGVDPPDRHDPRLSFGVGARLGFWLADVAGWLSRRFTAGRGRTLPGRLVVVLVPDALTRLAAHHRLIVVSGTNGKTTTTSLVARALQVRGRVISNTDGANLVSGVLSTLLEFRGAPSSFAVLEVDEVALTSVLQQTHPEVVVLLNLSRDQLDRTSEVSDHVDRWSSALQGCPSVAIVANADDALVVAAVVNARPTGTRVVWVRAGKPYRLDASLCPRCGQEWDAHATDWLCGGCGLSRPQASWQLEGGDVVSVGGHGFRLDLDLPGRANASNAVMAAAAAFHLGVPVEAALEQMRTVRQVDGRYAQIVVGDRQVRLLLAKNPAGWLEALDQLSTSSTPVVVSVNARDADGTDPSWLWDVPFERLRGRVVVAAGERCWDVSVRLSYAEIEHLVEPDGQAALTLLPPGPCDVVANYTAFVALRDALSCTC
jgi:UDP-N-acetylmuramyl tripeptide synthase